MWKVISLAVVLSAFVVVIQAQGSCVQCTSQQTPDCIDPDTNFFQPTTCTGAPSNGSCFSRVDINGQVVRGCSGNLDNETFHNCSSETCQTCMNLDGLNPHVACNNGLFPEGRISCIICTGGVNSTCAGVFNGTMTMCPLFASDDRCYVARPDGNYERGCLSSTTRCRNERCHTCSGNGCNFVDFSSAINIHSGAKLMAIVLLSIALTMINK